MNLGELQQVAIMWDGVKRSRQGRRPSLRFCSGTGVIVMVVMVSRGKFNHERVSGCGEAEAHVKGISPSPKRRLLCMDGDSWTLKEETGDRRVVWG